MDNDAIYWAVSMQRIGGWCAMAGAALLTVAAVAYGSIGFGRDSTDVLQAVAQHASWYWTAVHAAFVAGALLWVVAFMGLNTSFGDVPARVLGHVGAVCLMLGAALYAINSFVSGTALTALAAKWLTIPNERAQIAQAASTLLSVLRGMWIGVIVLFHGVPFVLMGVAVARDLRFPRALRWLGVVGGIGAVLTGALMLAMPDAMLAPLYQLFGAVTALWMIGVGIVIKRPADRILRRHGTLQAA